MTGDRKKIVKPRLSPKPGSTRRLMWAVMTMPRDLPSLGLVEAVEDTAVAEVLGLDLVPAVADGGDVEAVDGGNSEACLSRRRKREKGEGASQRHGVVSSMALTCHDVATPSAGMAGALGIQVMSDRFGRCDRQTVEGLAGDVSGATKTPPGGGVLGCHGRGM